jgi:hypothetical protein
MQKGRIENSEEKRIIKSDKMKNIKKYKHITDLIHFGAVDEKIREEKKEYCLVMDVLGRANFLHLFHFNNTPNQEVFSYCKEYKEFEEEMNDDLLYSETEFKIYIVGNPHYTYCKKCMQNFNKRK